tara:strand:- start:230 stop:544 length:315 start_codon:yes stop_codon:yes gene_type:complete
LIDISSKASPELNPESRDNESILPCIFENSKDFKPTSTEKLLVVLAAKTVMFEAMALIPSYPRVSVLDSRLTPCGRELEVNVYCFPQPETENLLMDSYPVVKYN